MITRPGADERKPETAGTEKALAGLGYRIAHIEEPGTLDGGDVLKHGGTVWVGLGGRTNQAGLDQLRAHLEPLGATVVGVPVTKVLHLKSAVTALPDGTVIGYDPLVDDPTAFPSYLSVPEEPGAHVVLLDGSTVLMSTSAPRTRELFESRGLRVVAVDISEYEKLEGCVTCLSIRLARLGSEQTVLGGLGRRHLGVQPGVEERREVLAADRRGQRPEVGDRAVAVARAARPRCAAASRTRCRRSGGAAPGRPSRPRS